MNEAKHTALNTFYDVYSCTNDNLEAVALLIQIQKLEINKKILKDLENSKIDKYHLQLNSILDMRISTIQDISKIVDDGI